jgi:hypothetical protein
LVPRTTIRSKPLLALGLALLAAAGMLALGLHDGVAVPPASQAAAGDEAVAKGEPTPFVVPPTPAWAPVRAALGNLTYSIATGDPGLLVLATGPDVHTGTGTVVVRGPVLLRSPAPDGSGRTLLVLAVRQWDTPLLFG